MPPALADLLVEPDELEELVVQEVGQTALFGARFRENAARALLIPRRRPGQRTPLWQQRLKAQSLLEVARPYGSFPIVLETYRECLQDVFDLPALRGHPARLSHPGARPRRGRDRRPPRRWPPRSSSTTSRRTCTRTTRPPPSGARRRCRSTASSSASCSGRRSSATSSTPARSQTSRGRFGPCRGTRTSSTTSCAAVGDLRAGELDAGFAETLVRERRAFRATCRRRRRGRSPPRTPGLYRDAFGVMPPGGLPESFLEPVDDALDRVLLRYARSHGPFTTGDAAARYRLEPDGVEIRLAALETRDLLVRGELRPGGIEREWCDPDVLRRIRRASLAVLRREVEPTEQVALGRFLPAWHGIDRKATLREALVPLQGLALPVALWETEILPRRVPGYQPAVARPAVRVGRGRLGRRGPRSGRALLPRGRAAPRAALDGRAAERPRARRDPRRARPERGVLARPARRDRAWTRARRCRRCGSSSGAARCRTTRGRRFAPSAATAFPPSSAGRAGSRAREARRRSRRPVAGR